jgi:hypothetical protein
MTLLADFFSLYKDEFLPAYNEMSLYLYIRPTDWLTRRYYETNFESENALFHLILHLSTLNESDFSSPRFQMTSSKDLDAAYKHLLRLTLDCRKITWIALDEDFRIIANSYVVRKSSFTVPERQIDRLYLNFKKSALKARIVEMENVGKKPEESLKSYATSIDCGKKLFQSANITILKAALIPYRIIARATNTLESINDWTGRGVQAIVKELVIATVITAISIWILRTTGIISG